MYIFIYIFTASILLHKTIKKLSLDEFQTVYSLFAMNVGIYLFVIKEFAFSFEAAT